MLYFSCMDMFSLKSLFVLKNSLAFLFPPTFLKEDKNNAVSPFLVGDVEEGHGGEYKAPTKEERRKWKAKRRERSDQVNWY